ncbi:MAG: rhomboid family intramembrane serine protease [Bryobacterales bacterium]|nr:rhomboid family intramembrane serine protease [Bryobacterales bacterium]MBV9396920.1 rhomboid family intramembrane serine protease [Bryobacterales bacterium]
MIPLRSTERVYSTAKVTGSLIAVNLLVFLYQASLPAYALNQFVEQWGIVPDRLHLASLFTSMFLHGSWMHVLGNMLFLWVFGRNVEDLLGGARFLVFYVICGLAAAMTQIVTNLYSPVPTIGASGAIAGVMGAYLVKFPRARIVTLLPIFFFFTTMEIPAALLLLFWFGMQFLSGVGSLTETDYSGGGVAFFAHIGGFVAGMLLIRLFPERRRWRTWNYWDQ